METDRGPAASRAVVLGPRGDARSLGAVLGEDWLPPGPVATITVGWREVEPVAVELGRAAEAADRELLPLELAERTERIFDIDPELREAHRRLQEGIRAEERLYGERLYQSLGAASAVERLAVPDRYRAPYAVVAREAVLETDRFHIDQQSRMWGEFRSLLRPSEREALRRERAEIEALLGRAAVLLAAGGHAAIIRNRLLLLDLAEEIARLPVIAWSAGAMVLSPLVVLFHDRLPYGSAKPEFLGEGLGVLPGVAFFPDASRRLELGDEAGLRELARRVAPLRCVLLDEGDRLDLDGDRWTSGRGFRALAEGGEIEEIRELEIGRNGDAR